MGDVQSPLGPQGQQEEGKSEVQHGTQIDDQESSWSSPDEDYGRDVSDDEGGGETWAGEALVRIGAGAGRAGGVASQALCRGCWEVEPGDGEH